ncbi:hypothetical protein [Clostridium aminobutyricum]|uniref:Uncharacterized protein n=1 Tax=Clostridium aminobutyricum TaxID=33953 RepID=A0A939D6I3_CLOAM|nr:hypothetical protein [Clostridium aminobutyricum]MBN7771997.1 hypothetical protein [Clostridium aminobutyricum]
MPQACLARQNGQQGAERVGAEGVAFLPQACLARQNGQQGAERVGAVAVRKHSLNHTATLLV